MPVNGEQTRPGSAHAKAWAAVASATDPAAQRAALDAFLALERPPGARPVQVHVYRRGSGERARIDQSLWDEPAAYEVELRLNGDEYRFVPLSRASLEPLFRE